jgi:hypothetical protein
LNRFIPLARPPADVHAQEVRVRTMRMLHDLLDRRRAVYDDDGRRTLHVWQLHGESVSVSIRVELDHASGMAGVYVSPQ